MDAELEAFRQQVIEGVRKHGYFEVDEDFLEGRAEANARARQAWAKLEVAKPRVPPVATGS